MKQFLKELFCNHNYFMVKERILIETALIKCKKCNKEKRITFQESYKKNIISHETYALIMSDYH